MPPVKRFSIRISFRINYIIIYVQSSPEYCYCLKYAKQTKILLTFTKCYAVFLFVK